MSARERRERGSAAQAHHSWSRRAQSGARRDGAEAQSRGRGGEAEDERRVQHGGLRRGVFGVREAGGVAFRVGVDGAAPPLRDSPHEVKAELNISKRRCNELEREVKRLKGE